MDDMDIQSRIRGRVQEELDRVWDTREDPWAPGGALSESTIMNNDSYMAVFFDGAEQPATDLLRAVTGLQLDAVDVRVHQTVESLGGRRVQLDVIAEDQEGRRYDVEVQARPSEAPPRRARYYAAALDSDAAKRGSGWEELPDAWVIFLCDGDALGLERPRVDVERVALQTSTPFQDGGHVVYLDVRRLSRGEGGDAALNDLAHDLLCNDPDKMRIDSFAARSAWMRTEEVEMEQLTNYERALRRESKALGEQVGQKVGQEIGQELGQELGQEIGQKLGQEIGEEMVRNLLARGVDKQLVKESTRLSPERVDRIAEEVAASGA